MQFFCHLFADIVQWELHNTFRYINNFNINNEGKRTNYFLVYNTTNQSKKVNKKLFIYEI